MKGCWNRPVLGWALYDFANSAFATTILSVVFNVYFVQVVCAGGVAWGSRRIPGESFWGYTLSASMLCVFALAPLLGAVADAFALKKRMLAFFCTLGCLFTGLLFFCREGDAWPAAVFFLLANVGFSAGNSFYNAFLNDLCPPESAGRVSGFGWALGYVGGGLLLALNLWMIRSPQDFAIPPGGHLPVRSSFLSVSLWWAVFSIPLFLWVKEDRSALLRVQGGVSEAVRRGVADVLETFRRVRAHRNIVKFLLAYVLYNDGIETVIVTASIFGARELGLSPTDLILCFLMIQGVAFLGALVFGELADRWRHKRTIALSLWIYLGACLWAAAIRSRAEFWVLGAVVGLVLGGSQSASRSFLSLLAPRDRSAQFFGFFSLAGKLSALFGPLLFAVLAQRFSLRVAVAGLSAFFALGLAILYFVDEAEPRTGLPR